LNLLAIYCKIWYPFHVSRRIYNRQLRINGKSFTEVVIDPHYEEKHASSVNDEVIIGLVMQLDGKTFQPTDIDEDGYQYFVNDHLEYEGKFYKLIWLIHDEQIYVGVVNAYRR
jgi:hypothetical protein